MVALKRSMFSPSDPRGPTRGEDVKIAKFGIGRFEDGLLPRPSTGYTETFGPAMEEAVKIIQKRRQIQATGNIGTETWDVIWNYLDAYRKYRYRMFKVPVAPSPPLIEPIQGFYSLVEELWADFSLGRNMGLSDLGTYNGASVLPSGAKSDHAYWPSFAFDLGVSPQTGWNNLVGRAFFTLMVGRSEVHYVILGDKIWSREQGLHAYTYGNHDNHCHVSGLH
jgi:hypothetical protein